MIVEDQHLPIGERAHRFNFLVLDTAELRALFKDSAQNGSILSQSHSDPAYADRLKVHLVPKTLLSNISSDSRRDAIKALQANALAEALAIRDREDAKSGRLYGFWTMQHFNATVALGCY